MSDGDERNVRLQFDVFFLSMLSPFRVHGQALSCFFALEKGPRKLLQQKRHVQRGLPYDFKRYFQPWLVANYVLHSIKQTKQDLKKIDDRCLTSWAFIDKEKPLDEMHQMLIVVASR